MLYAVVRAGITLWIVGRFASLAAEHATTRHQFAWSITVASGFVALTLWLGALRSVEGGDPRRWVTALCVVDEIYFLVATCAFGATQTSVAISGTVIPPVLATLFVGLDFGLGLAAVGGASVAFFAVMAPRLGYTRSAQVIPEWPLYAAYSVLYAIPAWMFGRFLAKVEGVQRTIERVAIERVDVMRAALRDETEANRVHNDLHAAENGLFQLEAILGRGGGQSEETRHERLAVAFAARTLGERLRRDLEAIAHAADATRRA